MSRNRVKGLILAVLAPFVLLELVLQAVALYVWLAHRPRAIAGAEGERVILCVGDSLTYGIGASIPERSYPRQLEHALRQAPAAPWRVVNAGWSGQDSREVLQRLDGQLRACSPERVYVLVGLNDYWNRPAGFVLPPDGRGAGPDPEAFPIRWRTGRLLRLLRGARMLETPPATSSGDRAAPGPALPFGEVDGTNPARVAVDPSEPHPGPRAWECLNRGEFAQAAKWFELDLERHPQDVGSHQGLVSCYARLSRRDEALAELEWLRQSFAREPGRGTAQALLAALEAIGAVEERLELARKLVETDPDWSEAWLQLARCRLEAGDPGAARASLDRALELGVDADRDTRRGALFSAHRLLRDADPAGSLAYLIRIKLEVGDSEPLLREIQNRPQRTEREVLDLAIASLALSEEQARQVIEVHSRALADPQREPVLETLELHLGQLVQRCRARGARPVLLTYPFWHDEHRRAMARVAQATGAELVDLNPAFARALATRKREELFAPNGHCSDEGYRLMAEVVAEHVQAERPQDPVAAPGVLGR